MGTSTTAFDGTYEEEVLTRDAYLLLRRGETLQAEAFLQRKSAFQLRKEAHQTLFRWCPDRAQQAEEGNQICQKPTSVSSSGIKAADETFTAGFEPAGRKTLECRFASSSHPSRAKSPKREPDQSQTAEEVLRKLRAHFAAIKHAQESDTQAGPVSQPPTVE